MAAWRERPGLTPAATRWPRKVSLTRCLPGWRPGKSQPWSVLAIEGLPGRARWRRIRSSRPGGISMGTLSKVTMTLPSSPRVIWSVRIATIVWSGWANRSVNSPPIRAWSAMVSSWSSVLIWSQRSASVPMTSGSVVPLQGIVMLVFARARLSQATKVCWLLRAPG